MIQQHYYYIAVNILCIGFPFLFSFQKWMPFYKNWKALVSGIIAMMALFIPWDMYFTANGVWGFNPKYISGTFLGNLPLEEWLFFICIPYASIFTYECFHFFLPKLKMQTLTKYLSVFYMLLAVFFLMKFTNHWYTFSTSLVALILLALHTFYWKSKFMNHFHISWIVLLIPFYISNGVLTGLDFWQYPLFNATPEIISDQIVWYNNDHNLGFRIWSVPMDDFFYGMSMLLLAITVYERVLKRPDPSLTATNQA